MAEPVPSVQRRLVAATALAAALAPLNSTMLSVAIHPIGTAFASADADVTRALVTSYLIGSIVMQAPGGLLADRLGHRRVVVLGQIGFALGSSLALASTSLWMLVVARVAMATAGAFIVPGATALLRAEVPPAQRGRAFGLFGASMALAATIGPPLGGLVTTAFGWRAVFAINLVVLPISALLAGAAPSVARSERRAMPFDWRGAALFAVALASLVIGAGRGGVMHPRWLGLGVATLVAFVFAERSHASPIVDLSLLRTRAFLASGLVIALHNLTMYSVLFELPAMVRAVLHVDASTSGRLLLAMMAPMVVAGPISGRLVDAIGARVVAATGAAIALAGMIVLLLVPLRSIASPVPALVVLGIGFGLSSAPSQSAAMSAVAIERSGVAAGMLSTMRYLGGVVGTLVVGATLRTDAGIDVALRGHRHALTVFVVALAAALDSASALPRSGSSRGS